MQKLSNTQEVLHPVYPTKFSNKSIRNPGAKQAVKLSEKEANMEVVGDPVTSVTLKDLMEMAETNTFILKLDIQDYDCQV